MPSSPKSIIFAGTPEFAVPSLQALIDDDAFSVDLVITQPDKPVGRKQVITPPPIKVLAKEHQIPVEQPSNINSFQFPILNFDFLVVVAYGQILSQKILDMPSVAPLNIHPSLLPQFRGASPIQNALLSGDTKTGVTIMKLVKEMDAGPMYAQHSIDIEPSDTSEIMHTRLAQMGADLLVKTLKNLPEPKDQDASQVTLCKKLTRADGEVDPLTMTAEEIDRRVRALVPWPGVTCTIDDQTIKILETTLELTDESIALSCANNTILHIKKLTPPGKRPMTGIEWKRGNSS